MRLDNPLGVYLYGEAIGLALLLPYSVIVLLLIGSAVLLAETIGLIMTPLVLPQLAPRLSVLLSPPRMIVMAAASIAMALELVPSFAAVLGIGCAFGAGYGELAEQALGLAPRDGKGGHAGRLRITMGLRGYFHRSGSSCWRPRRCAGYRRRASARC